MKTLILAAVSAALLTVAGQASAQPQPQPDRAPYDQHAGAPAQPGYGQPRPDQGGRADQRNVDQSRSMRTTHSQRSWRSRHHHRVCRVRHHHRVCHWS